MYRRKMNGEIVSKIWRVSRETPIIRDYFAERLGINPIVAQILLNRGFDTVTKAREFLQPDFDALHNPFSFSHMERAVNRIYQAIESGEKILVYGDYDVDGITSIAVLLPVLRELGADVDYYIPNRVEEGYGLNMAAVESAADNNVKLMITVDCGISAHAEVQLASDLGIDIIITDHHESPKVLPNAYAIINPKVPGDNYPFADLAGVGVAFKLAEALLIESLGERGRTEAFDRFSDLVALGTVADVASLLGENRVIVKFGLNKLSETENLGLQALMQVSGLKDKRMDPIAVGYSLAPRINAVGRMGDPGMGVELLLASRREEAERLARVLDAQNRERKELEAQILEEALSLMPHQVDLETERVIVLAGKGWHTGVVGIVASRICEMYYRPTILICIEDDEARGSGRSIEGFHMYEALSRCSDTLLRFGGHEQAAGLAISPDKIDEFRKSINLVANEVLDHDDLIPKIDIECRVELENLDFDLLNELSSLGPFGMRNPEPLFCLTGVRVAEYRTVGNGGRHLKVKVQGDGGITLDAIGFDMSEYCNLLFDNPDNIDVAFALNENTWNGHTSIQLRLVDIRKGGSGYIYPTVYRRELDQGAKDQVDEVKELLDDVLNDNGNSEHLFCLLGMPYVRGGVDGAQFNTILKELVNGRIVVNRTKFAWNDGFYSAVCGILAGIRRSKPVIFVCTSYLGCRRLFRKLQNLLGHTVSISMAANCFLTQDAREREECREQDFADVIVMTKEFFMHSMVNGKDMVNVKAKACTVQPSVLVFFADTSYFDFCSNGDRICSDLPDIRKRLGGTGTLLITEHEENVLMMENEDVVVVDHTHLGRLPGFQLIDRRNERDRQRVLNALLDKGKGVLIYVSTPSRADELIRDLMGADEERRVLYYHEGLSSRDREAIARMLKDDLVDVIVATSSFGIKELGWSFSDVVLFDMPIDLSELRFQCFTAGDNGNVYLLFNRDDTERVLRLVEDEYPARDRLATLYIALKRICRDAKVYTGTIGDVLEFYERCFESELRLQTLFVGLEVFQELDLVDSTVSGADIRIEFPDNNGEKANLEDSACFLEGVRMREELTKWTENLHNLDIESIMELIR